MGGGAAPEADRGDEAVQNNQGCDKMHGLAGLYSVGKQQQMNQRSTSCSM